MDDLPLKGSASDIFLPRLFGQLHQNRFEGVVRIALGQTAKVIYYRAGEIASAASNAESDRLAHLFVNSGRLTPEQLDLARARIAPGASFGKTLIGMGFLTPAELVRGARDQVRQILNSCFLLTSGHYECDPGPLPPEVTALGLPTRRLIFDALMQAHDRQWIVRQLGSMESVYTPTDDLVSGLEALGLDPTLARVARYMDGSQTLRDLSSRTALDDFTVSKLFLALEILGMSRLVGSPPRADAVSGRRIEITPEVAPLEPILLDLPLEADPVHPLTAPNLQPNPQDAPQDQKTGPEQTIVEGFVPTAPTGEPPLPAAREREIPFINDSPEPVSAAGTGESEPGGTSPIIGAMEEPHPRVNDTVHPAAEQAPADPDPPLADVTTAPKRTRRDDPEWQIDPQTGERVAFGPVELTFDGKVSSDEEPSSRWTRWLGLTAAAVVIISAALIYIMRNSGETGDAGPIASTAPPPEARDTQASMPAIGSPGPEQVDGNPDDDAMTGEEAGDGMQTADAGQAAGTRAVAQETPGTNATATGPTQTGMPGSEPDRMSDGPRTMAEIRERSPEKDGARPGGAGVATGPGRPSTAAVPIPESPPADPPRGSVSPFQDPSRYASALKILDEGDPDRAARIFQDLVVAERPDSYTMQLMIACQADTLRSIRAWSGDRGSLFIVPFSFKGRACFRICWGLYPTSSAADGARSDLPLAYTESGVTPIVIPITRFRPPA